MYVVCTRCINLYTMNTVCNTYDNGTLSKCILSPLHDQKELIGQNYSSEGYQVQLQHPKSLKGVHDKIN